MCRRNSESDLRIAQRLQASGVPLAVDGFDERVKVIQDTVRLSQRITSYFIIPGSLGLKIECYITIVGNSSEPFRLNGFQVRLPWKEGLAILLQDPADYFAPQIFKFPGENSGGYGRSDVIVQSHRTLTFGRSTSGWLLAWDNQPIPEGFRHGSELSIILDVIDQFDNAHPRELRLMVDRLAERTPPKPRVSRHRSLFAKPDAQKTNTEEVTAAR
jgi:hypothetical protein